MINEYKNEEELYRIEHSEDNNLRKNTVFFHEMGYDLRDFYFFRLPFYLILMGLFVFLAYLFIINSQSLDKLLYSILFNGLWFFAILMILLSHIKFQYLRGLPFIKLKYDHLYYAEDSSFGEYGKIDLEGIIGFNVKTVRYWFWDYHVFFCEMNGGDKRLPFRVVEKKMAEKILLDLNQELKNMKEYSVDKSHDDIQPYDDEDVLDLVEYPVSTTNQFKSWILMALISFFSYVLVYFMLDVSGTIDVFFGLGTYVFFIILFITFLFNKKRVSDFCSPGYKFKKDEIIVSQYGMMKQIFKLEQLALCELKEGNSDHSELKIMDEEGRMLIVKGSSEEIQMVNKFLEGQMQSIKLK